MSLQGSIHKWSDGIGYGAFIPTDRAYFNAPTSRVSARDRRPSSETRREYRRHNVTAGIDTHRSDISFGRATESIRGGLDGDSRAREATRSLTSGEVGGFRWPAERARDKDVETILASVSQKASLPEMALPSGVGKPRNGPEALSARSLKKHEQAAQENVIASRGNDQREQRSNQTLTSSAQSPSPSLSGGPCTRRSDATTAASSSVSYNSSRISSSRSSFYSGDGDGSSNGRRTRRTVSCDSANCGNTVKTEQLSHRSAREKRLRPPSLRPGELSDRQGSRGGLPPSPSAPKLKQFQTLDPVFNRHHKFDMIANEREALGGEVTGRFGPVHGSSVLAASLLTSELSTPWSHVLRGQKW